MLWGKYTLLFKPDNVGKSEYLIFTTHCLHFDMSQPKQDLRLLVLFNYRLGTDRIRTASSLAKWSYVCIERLWKNAPCIVAYSLLGYRRELSSTSTTKPLVYCELPYFRFKNDATVLEPYFCEIRSKRLPRPKPCRVPCLSLRTAREITVDYFCSAITQPRGLILPRNHAFVLAFLAVSQHWSIVKFQHSCLTANWESRGVSRRMRP